MPLSLTSLLAAPTSDEVRETQAALAAAAGFPTTAWQSGGVGRTFFAVESLAYADLAAVIGAIASSGFLDWANSGWLDLLAQQFYNLQRAPAVFTRGKLRLSDAGGVGPVTIQHGQLYAQSGGVRFRNLTGGTLPLSGNLDTLVWEAEFSGVAGNVLDGAAFELVTSLPGVSVTQLTPLGGTWITQQGADPESDENLRARCRNRWDELGHGASAGAYLYWVRTAAPEITRAIVQESTGDGIVRVVVAGSNGPISGTAFAAAQAYLLDPVRRVQCVRPQLVQATPVAVPLFGAIKAKASQLASAKAAALAVISRFFAALPLGAVIYRAPLEAAILASHPAIVNAALGNDAETYLASNAVPLASIGPSLSWGAA